MIEQYKDDFFLMLQQSMGYLPWVKTHLYRLDRILFGEHDKFHQHRENHHRQLVRMILEEKVCENEVIDIFFKAIIRAEQRFSSRFIPQRSNEERLTGHLISEMGASIELAKPYFTEASLNLTTKKKLLTFSILICQKVANLKNKQVQI